MTVGIRPEHFVDGGDLSFDVAIDVVEHLGGSSLFYTRPENDERLVIECKEARHVKGGHTASVQIQHDRLYLFDDTGIRLR